MQADQTDPTQALILDRTTAFCIDCRQSHPATIERCGNEVFFRSDCPRGPKETRISSDADLFLAIRRRGVPDAAQADGAGKWTYVVDVTNDCDLACPVCLNPRRPDAPLWYLAESELDSLADRMASNGRRAVILTGGEPTRHPGLPSLARLLRRRGFRISLATNGVRIAREPGYAKILRRAGVRMVFLQMDTLDEDVHERMRGNRDIAGKIEAVRRSVEAGLRVAFVVTATRCTLATLGGLLRYALALGPALSLIDIHVAAPFGRFGLPPEQLVDREEVIHALLACPALAGVLRAEHLRPPLAFRPWGSPVHPDCSAGAILLLDQGHPTPIDDVIDMSALSCRLAANRMESTFWARNAVPFRQALACTRPGKRMALFRHVWGTLRRRGQRSALAIMVNDMMRRDALDEARLRRCATCNLSGDGERPACLSCWLGPAEGGGQ